MFFSSSVEREQTASARLRGRQWRDWQADRGTVAVEFPFPASLPRVYFQRVPAYWALAGQPVISLNRFDSPAGNIPLALNAALPSASVPILPFCSIAFLLSVYSHSNAFHLSLHSHSTVFLLSHYCHSTAFPLHFYSLSIAFLLHFTVSLLPF